ncbi:hypothetical protein [Bartonella schoenbuchensis]|uniref:hypothetical protein n=1 Tax=Bartonella schoenbuchensis TaxID=165694 RepID=UPI001ABA36C3|nr:hypothetical protein [Bartonella schoenbuchensis]
MVFEFYSVADEVNNITDMLPNIPDILEAVSFAKWNGLFIQYQNNKQLDLF